MRNARTDVKVSRSHREIAAILHELGVPHEVGMCRLTPSNPVLKAPTASVIETIYDELLSDVAFRFNLRCYNEVERLTNDGYFSTDLYMPDGDIALEFDGRGLQSSTYQLNLSCLGPVSRFVSSLWRAITRRCCHTLPKCPFVSRKVITLS